MITYPIPMVPGPVMTPAEVLAAYQQSYGSGDLEKEYLELYQAATAKLQRLLGTQNRVALMTGEGMLALWSALKSVIQPGDRVLSVATGVFGYGVGDMARSIGAQVRTVGLAYNETITDWDRIERMIADFRPKMITVVHCETPSGTLNPLENLGALKRQYEVPLLYVDAVASAGGAPVNADACSIDLCLGGSQKVLAVPPDMCFLSVSERAWEIAAQVNYPGYDALLPFRNVTETGEFPYTPNWHGTAAMDVAAGQLLAEGLDNVFARHEKAAQLCRSRLQGIGIELYPIPSAVPSPTVTAANVPEDMGWAEFDSRLRRRGLVVGGSYGPLAGKVFRVGHMGPQADIALVNRAVDVIEDVVLEWKASGKK